MGKHVCCVCEKDVGLFTGKTTLKDGIVCNKCLKMGGISSIPDSRQFSASHIRNIIKSRAEAVKNYRATKKFGQIEIDLNTHSFKINNNFYLFDNLVSYSYHEDPVNQYGSNQTEKNNGAAIGSMIGGLNGGLIGGAVGAAVGGAVGFLFSGTCNYMNISVTLQDAATSDCTLHFITEKTKTSSPEYAEARKKANSCLEALQIIKDQNDSQHQPSLAQNPKSSESKSVFVQDKHFTSKQMVDELEIYKTLLYNGDITQEEYDQKRKQLLALK